MPAFLFALLCGVAAAMYCAAAGAQPAPAISGGNSSVTVDLSVLEDGGYGRRPGVPLPGATLPGAGERRLLMPGAETPVSRLHVPVSPADGGVRPAPTERPRFATPPPAKAPASAAARKPKPATPRTAKAPPPAATPPKPPDVAGPKVPQPPQRADVAVPKAPQPPPQRAAKPAPAPPKKSAPPTPPKAPSEAIATRPPPLPPASVTAETKTAAIRPAARAARGAQEQASRAPAEAAAKPGRALRLSFAGDATKVPPAAQGQLKTLVEKLRAQEHLRLQLLAYAGGKSLSSSKARRLSLSRALSVRSYLIGTGMRSTRIDVRALGDKTTEEPINRVDVVVTER